MNSRKLSVDRLYTHFIGALFLSLSLILGSLAYGASIKEAVVFKNLKTEICMENCEEERILIARHRGRHHSWRGGQGAGGTGVCPQPRSTPAAPEKFLKMTNPLPSTQSNILAGKEIFQFEAQPTACKVCHGAVGNGLGPMATGAMPLPRNFTCAENMKDISDGQMFYIITHGSQGSIMPAYLNLSDEQVWQLITFIRTLTKKRRF